MKKISFLIVLALMTFFYQPAQVIASPVAYDESLSGDLGFSYLANVGSVDLGINTISGHIQGVGTIDRWDSFSINIPVGLEVTLIELVISNFYRDPEKPDDRGGANLLYDDSSIVPIYPEFSSDGILSFPMTLSAGDYNFCSRTGGPTGQVNFDYQWQFTAVGSAPVPEPATMLLLGSGLVGLAGFRRRLRRR